MTRYLLTASGKDRPGLVEAVAKILFEEGCNLEDSAMTRLQGEFAVLLILSGPARPAGLEKKLKTMGRRLSLAVQLKPLARRKNRAPANNPLLISVYGADRPGIVYRVAALLAKARVNISDLSTHRTEGKAPGYILYLEGEAPAGLSQESLEASLSAGTAGLGVTVSVKPIAAQAL
jgi:glycine cleavage system transcriptional repressor